MPNQLNFIKKGREMKHSILLIIAIMFSLQTLTAINSERTSKAVVELIGELVDNAQNIAETNTETISNKERLKLRLAHVAKIIKAVTLAIIEIIAANKQEKPQAIRAGDAHKENAKLQEEVEAHLRLILSEMLSEIDEIEQEESAE